LVLTAPVFLFIVSDYSKLTGLSTDEAKKWSTFAVQTVILWVSANVFVTCPRAIMDNDKVHKSLNLKTIQFVHLNVPRPPAGLNTSRWSLFVECEMSLEGWLAFCQKINPW
jgi:hypothetical protein